MTGAAAKKLTRLSVEYSLTEHCNISCHACAHTSDSQVLIDAVRASLRPVSGVRRMAQLAKAALQKTGARRSER